MKIEKMTVEQIRERMGADATGAEADRMRNILAGVGADDTDEITDDEWFELVAIAAS